MKPSRKVKNTNLLITLLITHIQSVLLFCVSIKTSGLASTITGFNSRSFLLVAVFEKQGIRIRIEQ